MSIIVAIALLGLLASLFKRPEYDDLPCGTKEQQSRYKELAMNDDRSEKETEEFVKLYSVLYPKDYKQHMDAIKNGGKPI